MEYGFGLRRIGRIPFDFSGVVAQSRETKCEPVVVRGDRGCRKPLGVLVAVCGVSHISFAAVVDIGRIRLACITLPLNRDMRVQYVGGGDLPIGMRLRTGDEVKAKNDDGEK